MGRDHWLHRQFPIMGGLWGAKNPIAFASVWREIIFNSTRNSDWGNDQQLLRKHLFYSQYQDRILIHDSYTCGQFVDAATWRPWPTKRSSEGATMWERFVGAGAKHAIHFKRVRTCPVECRPTEHKDWIFC